MTKTNLVTLLLSVDILSFIFVFLFTVVFLFNFNSVKNSVEGFFMQNGYSMSAGKGLSVLKRKNYKELIIEWTQSDRNVSISKKRIIKFYLQAYGYMFIALLLVWVVSVILLIFC